MPAPFFASGTTTVQWLRVDGGNETDIPSATDFTYTLVAADEGKTIKVKVVSFTDSSGFANGPLTSDAYPSSGTVLPAATTVQPGITGMALVSNFGESATSTFAVFGPNGESDLAQVFTTGSNATGYTLTSVEMAAREPISAADIGDLSVSVWSIDSSGNPQTKQFDLTNPASIDSATLSGSNVVTGNSAVFTAPNNTTLTQTTNYAVVLTYDQHGSLWASPSDSPETSAASGWSIPYNGGFSKPSGGSSWGVNKTFLIRVNGEAKAANTAPTSAHKTVETDEDTEYTFSSADFPFTDTDMGDSLSSVKIVSLPALGTLTFSGAALTSGDLPQTVTAADLAAGNLKYVPLANSNNGVSFTFRVNDGTDDSAATSTMNVGVRVVSDVATGQPGITGVAQVGEVLMATVGTIADEDGLPDPFFSVGDATTTVQWIRVDGAAETDIPSESATSSTYTLVAADEGKKIRVKVSFNDPYGFANGPLTSDAYPSSGAVLPAANIAPTSADKTVDTPEDTDYTFLTADFAFTDTDGGSLSSVKIVSLPATGKGTLTLSGTALTSGDLPQTVGADDLAAGNLKYAPPANDNGAALASFTFRVNDGTDDSVATKTMTVNVTAVNDAPRSQNKTVVTDEDTEYTFASTNFAFRDTDMGDTLSSVKIVTLPGKGTLTLSGTAIPSGALPQTVTAADLAAGNLKYVPLANSNGVDPFTFRVNDGTADSAATNTMTIVVQGVNDATTGQPGITGTAQVGEVLTATVGDIADVDGLPDPFFSAATTSIQWLRVDGGDETDIPGSASTTTYTLVAADEGKTIKVTVTFQDNGGSRAGPLTSDAYPSSGTVLPAPNIAPTSADKTVATDEDTDYTFSSADFPFTDTDTGDALSSVKIVTLPVRGTLTLSGAALTSGALPQTVTTDDLAASNLKYVPPANESGTVLASFTFRVNDGTDDSVATNTMRINVTAVNDVATGQPGITGTAQVGEVLTATAGDIADVDGLPNPFFESGTTTVQWLRVDGGNETDIPGATDFTYTLVAADEGKTIKVKVVSFKDQQSFANGPLTSDAYPSSGMVLPAPNIAPTSADKDGGHARGHGVHLLQR